MVTSQLVLPIRREMPRLQVPALLEREDIRFVRGLFIRGLDVPLSLFEGSAAAAGDQDSG